VLIEQPPTAFLELAWEVATFHANSKNAVGGWWWVVAIVM